MSVKLGSKLPRDDANGLGSLAEPLMNDPHRLHFVLCVVSCGLITEDPDDETRIPMARIRRIEPVQQRDYQDAHRILSNALTARHGSGVQDEGTQRDLFSLLHPGETFNVTPIRPGGIPADVVNVDDEGPAYDPSDTWDDADAPTPPAPIKRGRGRKPAGA